MQARKFNSSSSVRHGCGRWPYVLCGAVPQVSVELINVCGLISQNGRRLLVKIYVSAGNLYFHKYTRTSHNLSSHIRVAYTVCLFSLGNRPKNTPDFMCVRFAEII